MLRSKIVHLKKIYKFGFDHFLEKRTVFIILIKKTLLKIKSCGFRPNNARYKKMLRSKIVHLKEIYNFDFDHFLIKRTIFVLRACVILYTIYKSNLVYTVVFPYFLIFLQNNSVQTSVLIFFTSRHYYFFEK